MKCVFQILGACSGHCNFQDELRPTPPLGALYHFDGLLAQAPPCYRSASRVMSLRLTMMVIGMDSMKLI